MATINELLNAQAASQQQPTSNVNNTNNALPNNTVNPAAPTEGENRVNAMFDAQKDAQLKQLESAYNQSMSAQQPAKDKIAPQYQTAANDLAVQYERNRQNYNQQAAANGINTGAASQAALAQNNEYLRDFGALRASEGEALAEADRNMEILTTNYQASISAAIADNDYKRAAALLDEYNTQYTRDMKMAEMLASYGNFSGLAKYVREQQAAQMQKAWALQNPDMAYQMGLITDKEYMYAKAGIPMGMASAAGALAGSGGSWDYGGSGWNGGNFYIETGTSHPTYNPNGITMSRDQLLGS